MEAEISAHRSKTPVKAKPKTVFFQKEDVPADGNCLFHTIGFFYDENHLEVRKKCCSYLSGHQELLSGHQEMARVSYLSEMQKRGTYGGESELVAAARVYQFSYRVFVGNEEGYFLLGSFLEGEYDRQIDLLLIQGEEEDENHYSPLVEIGVQQ